MVPVSFSRAPDASTSLWMIAASLSFSTTTGSTTRFVLNRISSSPCRLAGSDVRDVEPVAALVQRQNVPRLGNLEVDQVLLQLVDVESGEVEQRHAERPRREDRELIRRNPLAGEDVVDKADPGLLRLRLQRFGLVLGHQAVLRERARETADVACRCGVGGHGLDAFELGSSAWDYDVIPLSKQFSCRVCYNLRRGHVIPTA